MDDDLASRAPAQDPADDRERELAELRRRIELVDRTRRALDIVATEEEAIATSSAAVAEIVPGRAVRVALDADDCTALRRPGIVATRSSREFDACAHLRGQTEGPVSGVCVPLQMGEDILGVLQWEGDEGSIPDRTTRGALDVVAHLLALRLTLLRSDGAAEAPLTDPLTGALNRRSTQRAVRDLVRDLVPFSLAVCDLDRFAAYNDAHGHDTGDRALRLFAETVRSMVRPGDVVGRTAGDVLTVAFPGTSALDAAQALERVREVLVLSLAVNDIPAFTASYGVADSNQGRSIEEIVETAELATALAKRSGANRVVVAGEETSGLPGYGTASDLGGDGL